jgi:hypothetical protein
MWGLLIANYLDQSLWSTNQKYWAAVRSNLLHFFLEVHNCVEPFTSHSKLHEFGAEKPISWAKPAHFHFLTIHFIVWSHILSRVQMLLPCIKKWDFVSGVLSFLSTSIGLMTYSWSFKKRKACEVALWGNSTEDCFTERQVRSEFCNLTHPGLYRGRRHYQWLLPLLHGVEGNDSSA